MIIDVEFIESESVIDVEFTDTVVVDNTRDPIIEPLTVTENGEYIAPENIDGYSPVNVNLPDRYSEGYEDGYKASQNDITLQEKTATENGEVVADEGYTGLKKVNVAVPIKEEQEKTVEITKNGTTEVVADEGKSMSKVTVNTNVAFEGDIGKPYIDTSKITNFASFCLNNRLNDYVDKLDTSNGTDFSKMFYTCTSLTSVAELDMSKGTSFNQMFYGCSNLESAPALKTSNGTDFSSMFDRCSKLKNIQTIDVSKGTNFSSMFSQCSKLESLPPLDISNGTNLNGIFSYCSMLDNLILTVPKKDLTTSSFYSCTALKNITIGEGWNVNIYLHYSNNLTVESLHGMIENLADLTGQTAKTFQIGATNLAKIDEAHITMLNNKNWAYQ